MSPPRKYAENGKVRSYWITAPNIEKLKNLAKQTGESMSQIVNKALQKLPEER